MDGAVDGTMSTSGLFPTGVSNVRISFDTQSNYAYYCIIKIIILIITIII
jgi:hypothetical protein